MNSSLETVAEEYFNSLNHLAKRISSDIQVKRDAYEEIWQTLSRKEQRQVMDETIIHPEAVLKYAAYPQDNPDYEYFPKLRLQTGEKYVVDEEGGKGRSLTWRDEHSAPFSWMTQSQLNLNVFCNKVAVCESGSAPKQKPSPPRRKPKAAENFEPPSIVLGGSSLKTTSVSSQPKSPTEKEISKPALPEENFLSKLRSKTAVLKLPPKGRNSKASGSESENLVRPGGGNAIKIKPKTVIAKPKTPPPPPPSKQIREIHATDMKDVDRESTGTWEEPNLGGSREEEIALLTRLSENDGGKSHKPIACIEVESKNSSKCQDTITETGNLQQSGSAELLATFNVDLTNPSADIPKTGFEFLDNW
ncbi:uncharacterized protein C1orf198 homolog [Ischnura elegans]|uniref:uncharacterized protein C1orf198 homolog n=1 Tax=Ischnura elegans TaxID=197161 RepID=UPI001ED88902|nr:uncharacterized protein C1orf198 homolog [Ischnura elegans]